MSRHVMSRHVMSHHVMSLNLIGEARHGRTRQGHHCPSLRADSATSAAATVDGSVCGVGGVLHHGLQEFIKFQNSHTRLVLNMLGANLIILRSGTAQCDAMQYSTVQYSTVQYNTQHVTVCTYVCRGPHTGAFFCYHTYDILCTFSW